MSRKDDPAYPEPGLSNLPNGEFLYGRSGMTIREHFAGLAMQGLLANPARCPGAEVEGGADAYSRLVAQVSTEFADALIAELERTK